MSQWTHVVGSFRIDGMPFLLKMNHTQESNAIIKFFGKPCNFDSSDKEIDECNVPKGSEGSIQFLYIPTEKDNSLSRGSVVIWGDLRDYDNTNEIVEWFKKMVNTIQMSKDCVFGIRDAVLSIEVEYGDKTICTIDNKENVTLFKIPYVKGE